MINNSLRTGRRALSDTWITDLTHFLDKEGRIAPERGPARRMAEFLTSIVSMASRPELVIPQKCRVQCRRHPGRKPCPGMIEVDLDPETEDVIWWCPVCGDNGYIRNWKGTVWDLSDADGEIH
jgi:hypothetical protein